LGDRPTYHPLHVVAGSSDAGTRRGLARYDFTSPLFIDPKQCAQGPSADGCRSSKTGRPVAEMHDSATGTAADERAFHSFSSSVMIGILALINSGGSASSVNKTVGAIRVEQMIAPVILSLAFEVLPPSRCAVGILIGIHTNFCSFLCQGKAERGGGAQSEVPTVAPLPVPLGVSPVRGLVGDCCARRGWALGPALKHR
jgi:hypothetical protein